MKQSKTELLLRLLSFYKLNLTIKGEPLWAEWLFTAVCKFTALLITIPYMAW